MEGFYFGNDNHIYLPGLYHDYPDGYDNVLKKECYITFEIPYEDKNSNNKFLTDYYENTTRFIVWKRNYSNEFIKYFKLLLNKYNIIDLYDKIFNIIDNDYKFNFNFDIYDYKLHRIVNTSTCWNDDRDIYEIEDNKVKKIIISHHSFHKCYIECVNNVISDIKYSDKHFYHRYELGKIAPNINEI